MTRGKTLEIRTSPHILSGHRVDTIMFNVVLALLPVTAFAVYAFGLAGFLTLFVATASCLATERAFCRFSKKQSTLGDWSVTITGLLYGLTLPPGLPLWMTAVGGFLAVALGKALFGGLGQNPFNPALDGRAILQAAFPVALTSWIPGFTAGRFATLPPSTLTPPFTRPDYPDVWTMATPLSQWKFDGQLTHTGDLALGFVGGSTGETCAVLILLGGLYLIARNMMSWRIPAGIFAAVAAFSGVLHWIDPQRYASPQFMLFSGGLMLGAMFMATDMVGSPMTGLGCFLYGGLIGARPHRPARAAEGLRDPGAPAMSDLPILGQPERPSAWKMIRAMVGVGLLCGLFIVTVYSTTRPVIERNEAEALRQAIFRVLPDATSSRTFRFDDDGRFVALASGETAERVVHAGYDDAGDLVGLAVEARGMGYQDVIVLIYGYSFSEDALVGIRVLASKETPGLGDRIESDADFLKNFERLDVRLVGDGTTVANPIETVKHGKKEHPWQVDGITGATISSVAVGGMLRESTAFWIPRIRARLDDFRREDAP